VIASSPHRGERIGVEFVAHGVDRPACRLVLRDEWHAALRHRPIREVERVHRRHELGEVCRASAMRSGWAFSPSIHR
jgi:hypothetical protein